MFHYEKKKSVMFHYERKKSVKRDESHLSTVPKLATLEDVL